MTAAGAITYSYDANGNLSGNSAGMSLSYNAKDQTTSITPAGGSATAMTYTGEGQSDRTQAGSTAFTANSLGLGYETTAGAPIYYTRTPTGELIGQRHPSGRHYLLTDGLGSVAKVIDASGAVVTSERYDPFGTTAASTGTLANAIKFAGEYKDPSGLYKIGERYFDPDRGRWTQVDPVRQVAEPREGTPYGYAGSDPVNFTDPSGMYIDWNCMARWRNLAICSKGGAPRIKKVTVVCSVGGLALASMWWNPVGVVTGLGATAFCNFYALGKAYRWY